MRDHEMPHPVADHELFLSLRYVPRLADASLDWLGWDPDYDIGAGLDKESWWVDRGVATLARTMSSEVASTDQNALHVVYLSGGLDSRAILGGLLEHLPTSRIVAATYGMPGTWDLEIARTICKKIGLRHVFFNLLDERWDLDQLAHAAGRLAAPVNVYQSHVRRTITNHFGSDCVYWSGFLGGHIGGQNLPPTPPRTSIDALNAHYSMHKPSKYRGDELWRKIFNKILLELPWDRLEHPTFDLQRQFEFGVRQRDYLRPMVVISGFDFKTPFTNTEWVNFMSRVPYKWLRQKYLFRMIVASSFKELGKIPAILTAGMPLTASRQRIFAGKVLARANRRWNPKNVYHSRLGMNYLDWGEALRHKGPLQESVLTTLESLGRREVISDRDIARWWAAHLERREDNATLLMNLSSLELLVQAGKIEATPAERPYPAAQATSPV